MGQTLLFTATARGEDGSGLGRTTYVTATLGTQEDDELLPFSSANPTAFTSTWTASWLVEPVLGDAIYDVPVEGQDANGLRGTSHIGIWTDITPPSVPHLIDPSLPHPVNQSTYPVKGTADRGSLVVLLVGGTTYTTTTGNELGVWEIPASLAAGPNSLRVKARDAAGNESPWSDPIILTLDQTPPGLATSVNPEWQRPSQPVTLTAVVTETDLLYWGDVWAAVSGSDPATQLSLTPPASQGGNPWQTIFLGGLEGTYSASLKARDRAGNTISQTQTFILDGTPPALAVTLSSAPPYGHVEGTALYYGEGSGVFTLTAVATDTLSKLGQLSFPTTTTAGQTYTYEGLTSQTQVHTYSFTTASTFSGNLTLDATDRAGNLTSEPFSVSYDNVAPTPPTITVPSAAPASFSLSWTGQDSGAGVRDYDVQVRDAITTTWTSWLTATTATEAQFTGSPGHSYYFQVRATDQVNNTGAWQQAGPVAIRSVTKYYTFGGSRVAMRQGDEVYYLYGDHLGSTSLTTDGSGAVVAQSRYLPYGQERWSDGAAPTDFGFTGQRSEAGFGLMDYQARYYAPGLGRFVSADILVPELLDPQTLNRYSYVENNPLRYTDPSGHICPECGADVLQGAAAEWASNNYDAAIVLPQNYTHRQNLEALIVDNQNNVAFQTGRAIGGLANIVQGAAEIVQGGGLFGGGLLAGTATVETGVGAVVGYGVAVVGAAEVVHGAGGAANGLGGIGESAGNIYNAIIGRGSGPSRPITINTSKGPLLSSQNRGDTKLYIQKNWYKGTFKSALDSAAYHLNKHGYGATIQEYTQQAQAFYRANWRSAETVPSLDGSTMELRRIRNESGFGIFTPDGRVVTFEPF